MSCFYTLCCLALWLCGWFLPSAAAQPSVVLPLQAASSRDVWWAQVQHLRARRWDILQDQDRELRQTGVSVLAHWADPVSDGKNHPARRRLGNLIQNSTTAHETNATVDLLGDSSLLDGNSSDAKAGGNETLDPANGTPNNAKNATSGNSTFVPGGNDHNNSKPNHTDTSGGNDPTLPPGDSSSTTNTTMVPLSNCHKVLYTAQIGIGTPTKQMFTLVLDSSSTDLWVPSTSCTTEEGCFDHWRRFDSSASDTFGQLNDNFLDNIYQNGNLQGQKVKDTIHLTNSLQVPNQPFALIDKQLPEQFAVNHGDCNGWDGYLGLGPTNEGFTEQGFEEDLPTLLGTLKREKLLPHSVFSLYLDAQDDYPPIPDGQDRSQPVGVLPSRASSEIVFGGVKSSHYKGCLNWHNLHPYTMSDGTMEDVIWNFDIEGVRVGNVNLPDSKIAIIDSRASVTIGTPAAIGAYAKHNNMECFIDDVINGFKIVACDGPFELAYTVCDREITPLEFRVDGVSYTLDGSTLLVPVEAEVVGKEEDAGTPEGEHTWCLLDLIAIPDSSGWLLGDQFIRKYYTVFDFGNFSIGLAPRRLRDDESDPDSCAADAYLEVDGDDSFTSKAPTAASATTVSPTMAPGGDTVPVGTPAPSVATTSAPVPSPHHIPPHSAPHHSNTPPHPAPHHSSTPPGDWNQDAASADDANSPSGTIPLALLAVAALIGIMCCWRRRRRRAQYSRTGNFDDYRFGGDLELSEFS